MEIRERPITVAIMMTCIFAFGGWFAASMLFEEGLAASEWQITEGEITESRITGGRRGSSLQVDYVYSVNGRDFIGDEFGNPFRSDDPDELSALREASYMPGMRVEVHYDPQDPGNAIVDPSQAASLAGWGIIAVLAAAVGAIWIYAIKLTRTK